jgi:hypothetical protein
MKHQPIPYSLESRGIIKGPDPTARTAGPGLATRTDGTDPNDRQKT